MATRALYYGNVASGAFLMTSSTHNHSNYYSSMVTHDVIWEIVTLYGLVPSEYRVRCVYSMHCCRERSCVSPSILKQYSKPPKSLSIPIRLCVGLPDYCACVKCTARRSTMESAAKRPKLSLSLPKNRGKTRFGAPLSSDKMGMISKGKRSAYTKRSTSWAVTIFKEWIRERNESNPDDLCPDGFLELDHSSDVPQLERWLCRFVVAHI